MIQQKKQALFYKYPLIYPVGEAHHKKQHEWDI